MFGRGTSTTVFLVLAAASAPAAETPPSVQLTTPVGFEQNLGQAAGPTGASIVGVFPAVDAPLLGTLEVDILSSIRFTGSVPP